MTDNNALAQLKACPHCDTSNRCTYVCEMEPTPVAGEGELVERVKAAIVAFQEANKATATPDVFLDGLARAAIAAMQATTSLDGEG